MQTTIRQFQAEVRDILNSDPWFANHGIVWRAEDTLDIEFQIKDAISRTGLAAVVVTPNLTYQGEAETTTSRKNYEETEIPVECYIVSPPATVTLLTDPRTEMREGGELRFSDWYGQPSVFKWVPNSGFFWNAPTVEGTGEPYATITPPTDPTGTVWQANIFNGSSYSPTTISIPASSEFGKEWRTRDEQGREITIVSGADGYTVSGGCFGDYSLSGVQPDVESTEVSGSTEYKATISFTDGVPKTAQMSTRTSNLIGKPFDKKLEWVLMGGNLVTSTGWNPTLSKTFSFEAEIKRPAARNELIFGSSAASYIFGFRTVNDNRFQLTLGSSRNVTANFGAYRDSTGQFRAYANNIPQYYGNIHKIGVAASVNSSTTANNYVFNCGIFGNGFSGTNGTNNTIPGFTEGFTAYIGGGRGTSSYTNFTGTFYSAKVYEDGVLILNAYPVLADGRIRIYNEVSKTLLTDITNNIDPEKGVNYEPDNEWGKVTTDNSTVDFVETVTAIDKGFDTEISLQLIENPTVNRGKPDKDQIATALDAAHHAVYTLAGYDSGNFNNFNASTIRQTTVGAAQNKLLQVEAKLNSTVIL